ncbi:hypothetical protein DAI22_09g005900 [Oryza sativa Japonica Group]|nr:hypothetical protein DAI22_09g005900 [Oryza sativa Japonica Group]
MRPRAASPRGLPTRQSASSRRHVRSPRRGVSPGGGGFGPATAVPCVPRGFRRRRQPSTAAASLPRQRWRGASVAASLRPGPRRCGEAALRWGRGGGGCVVDAAHGGGAPAASRGWGGGWRRRRRGLRVGRMW